MWVQPRLCALPPWPLQVHTSSGVQSRYQPGGEDYPGGRAIRWAGAQRRLLTQVAHPRVGCGRRSSAGRCGLPRSPGQACACALAAPPGLREGLFIRQAGSACPRLGECQEGSTEWGASRSLASGVGEEAAGAEAGRPTEWQQMRKTRWLQAETPPPPVLRSTYLFHLSPFIF